MTEMSGMNLEEQAGVATAINKLAERRFTKFEEDVEEIIGRTYYDEEDFKKVKDLKMETDEITDKFEKIITYLESCYAGKPGKKENKIKDIVKNYQEITERRDSVRTKVKEANGAIEAARNEEAVRRREEITKRNGEGRGEGERPVTEKQFKQPTGTLPSKISRDYTPLVAQDWAADMKLYIWTCSNLDILSRGKQRTLCKRL